MITNIEELPTEVRNSLSDEDAVKWMAEYNRNLGEGLSVYASKEMAWLSTRFLPSSRYVCANVSTEIVDAEGDLANVMAYVGAGQELVRNGGILTRNHSNKIIGTVWKIEEGIDKALNKPCVIAYMNFFRGNMLWDTSWKEFREGRTEFSIGSFVKKPEHKCDSMGCYNELIPEQWFELSNVDRGINPRTYPIERNYEAKGTSDIPQGKILDMHEDICPAKARYLRFKEKMGGFGHKTHYGEDFILIHGLLGEDELAYVYEEYPDAREFEILRGEDDEDDYTLITPKPIEDTDDMLHSMIELMEDEQEAIQGYNTVMQSLRMGGEYSDEVLDKVQAIFDEIIHDEENHIGRILESIRIINPSMYSSIAEGMNESDESTKGCPAGQHEHAGVWGCHDVNRRHHIDDKTTPTDYLDLTDENINVNAIKDTPTERLNEIVHKIAHIIRHFTDDEVHKFLSSTQGKEFILAFLELKRRKVVDGERNMTEKEAGCSPAMKSEEEEETPVPEVSEEDKGHIPDIQASIANISSTLASVVAIIDQMNTRMLKLENMATESENRENGEMDITSAILGESDGMDSTPIMSDEKDEDEGKGEVPPQFEDKEESDGESEVEVEIETEDDDKDESEEEESDDDKESDDEESEDSEDDDSKEESDDKESKDSEDEDKSEDKEDSKDDDKESDDEESEDKKKGTEEVVEEVKEEVPEASPTQGEVAENTEPEPPVVEPEPQPEVPPVEDDFEMPVARGGNTVDFRAMLLKRQSELKSKGVEMYIAEAGAQNSLANAQAVHVSGTNLSLIQPSAKIKGFDAEMGVVSNADARSLWKDLGSIDNKTLLSKLLGE